MIMIVGSRGSGRTTELIRYSSESDIPILVGSKRERSIIEHKALKMGMDIPEPISIDVRLEMLTGRNNRAIAIDNVEAILRQVIGFVPTIVTCDVKNFATEDLTLLDCLALWRRSRRLYKKEKNNE